MSSTTFEALTGEKALHSNPLGTVTPHCLVYTETDQTRLVLSLARISNVKRAVISYPILLIIAAGTGLISCAAFASKQGAGAGPPFAIFSALLVAGYFFSKRASVCFYVDSDPFETAVGSPRDAAALVRAIHSAQEMYG
jgi:hypothetical protein